MTQKRFSFCKLVSQVSKPKLYSRIPDPRPGLLNKWLTSITVYNARSRKSSCQWWIFAQKSIYTS